MKRSSGKVKRTGHQGVAKVIFAVLVVFDVFPFEGIAAAAGNGLVVLLEMAEVFHTDYPLSERLRPNPWREITVRIVSLGLLYDASLVKWAVWSGHGMWSIVLKPDRAVKLTPR